MNTPHIGQSFTVFTSIDSTNLYAMNRIREGLAVHGDVFFAEEQTQGRGQRGRNWWSAPGENIQLSVVLEPLQLASSHTFRLSAAIACAVHDFLTGQSETGWFIKWPNDIYWGDRKAGGILIENVFQANRWAWAVIGIGLNINAATFPEYLPNPVSLKNVTGLHYNTTELAHTLCGFLENRFQQLLAGNWNLVLQHYNRVLYGLGQNQQLKKGNIVANYNIRGVDDQGHLVAGQHGEYLFNFGEVEWLLAQHG